MYVHNLAIIIMLWLHCTSNSVLPKDYMPPKKEYKTLRQMSQTLSTIDEVSHNCTAVAAHLRVAKTEQTLPQHPKTIKLLRLPDAADCTINEILSWNAFKFARGQAWHIHDYDQGKSCNENGKPKEYRVVLFPSKTMCPILTLKDFYKTTINKVKDGWTYSTLLNSPNVVVRKPEKSWHLLVKRRSIDTEDLLIKILITKFGLTDQVQCESLWHNAYQEAVQKKIVYIWVKKYAFAEFNAAFGFTIKTAPGD